jgi:hypothetical protein
MSLPFFKQFQKRCKYREEMMDIDMDSDVSSPEHISDLCRGSDMIFDLAEKKGGQGSVSSVSFEYGGAGLKSAPAYRITMNERMASTGRNIRRQCDS